MYKLLSLLMIISLILVVPTTQYAKDVDQSIEFTIAVDDDVGEIFTVNVEEIELPGQVALICDHAMYQNPETSVQVTLKQATQDNNSANMEGQMFGILKIPFSGNVTLPKYILRNFDAIQFSFQHRYS